MITTKISEEHLQLVKALSNESVDELNQTQIIGAAINEYANRNGYTKVLNGYATIGDTVKVSETRPLSAKKRWRLVEVLERAK